MLNSKFLAGGLAIVGLAVIASHFLLRNEMAKGTTVTTTDVTTNPTPTTSSNWLAPIASTAAPRMFVGGRGAPGGDWAQGGGSSVTSSTGRWAQ